VVTTTGNVPPSHLSFRTGGRVGHCGGVCGGSSSLGAAVLSAHVDTVENFRCETHASRDARRKRQLTIVSAGSVLQSRSPLVFVERSMCGTPIPLPHRSHSSAPYLIGSSRCVSHYLFCIMDPRQDVKQPRGVATWRRWRRRRIAMPANAHTPPERDKAVKRWIPLDLVQNTAEYLGRVPSLLSFRGVSIAWQGAVSDAVGFLNGRCWTRLGNGGPLWTSLGLDRQYTVARFALLCLAPRLETLKWRHNTDHLDFALRLLGENNTVLTKLSLEGLFPIDSSTQTTDVSWLRNYQALKILNLMNTSITNAGIRGLELIRTLKVLYLSYCNFITDVSCLRNCRVLKKLHLSYTNVTDGGIRGLELVPTLKVLDLISCKRITDVNCLRSCRTLTKLDLTYTGVGDAGILGLELISTLEVLIFFDCSRITDVSCLRSCPALKKLVLSHTSVTDAGIRGLELIPTLEELHLWGCDFVHDLSALRNRPFLRIIG
jgi:hypothetical protein